MRWIAGVIAGFTAVVLASNSPVPAAAQGQPKVPSSEAQGTGMTECDRLAQQPSAAMGGLSALGDGVSFAELRWPGARAACTKAMADAPGEIRFVAFAARAADKGGDEKTAAQLYRTAADEGYPLAQTLLGVMLRVGRGSVALTPEERATAS